VRLRNGEQLMGPKGLGVEHLLEPALAATTEEPPVSPPGNAAPPPLPPPPPTAGQALTGGAVSRRRRLGAVMTPAVALIVAIAGGWYLLARGGLGSSRQPAATVITDNTGEPVTRAPATRDNSRWWDDVPPHSDPNGLILFDQIRRNNAR